jgi:hypothetical protein
MTDRDMRPTRFDLTLEYARDFVTEWFDQNPLGQIGIVGMRVGIGERIGEMSGASSLSLPDFPLLKRLPLTPPYVWLGFMTCVCPFREPAGCAPRDFRTAQTRTRR